MVNTERKQSEEKPIRNRKGKMEKTNKPEPVVNNQFVNLPNMRA